MSAPYTPPSFKLTAFNCPFCNAYAAQKWEHLYQKFPAGHPMEKASEKIWFSWCTHCGEFAVWRNEEMLIPGLSAAPPPHDEMPTSIREDFEEARSVLQRSPRSAAALLRLSLQKLCKEIGEKGENINDDIANLVSKGLPVEVQQSLDIIRVIGNEQVHPGEIDVRDNPTIAAELFRLVNFVVEDRISRPKAIKALYSQLPPAKLQGIQKRDGLAK